MRSVLIWMLMLTVLATAPLSTATACPFCAAVSQTFSEEIDSMDVALIATLEKTPATAPDPSVGGVKANFIITQVLKGKEHLNDAKSVETLYYGEGRAGRKFLILGSDPTNLMWSTPTLLEDSTVDYILGSIKQPKDDYHRLLYFQNYLEGKDDMASRDAYDEFAKAPYDWLHSMKGDMNHDQLIEWLKNDDLQANHRRLYFTMLGVCGSKDDLPFLESLLKSDDRKKKAGLDALIGCYLTLAGADGMPLVEQIFLEDKEAEYADTYAAIMAIRFHGTETDIIPRERLLQGLHLMLDRPSLADLVIVDLARWEDWSVIDKLTKLFKEANDDSSWVRVPVIRYLMACPKPEAKEALVELEKIDPDAMKRAQTFFPFRNSGVTPSREAEQLALSNAKVGVQLVSATTTEALTGASPAVADAPAMEVEEGEVANEKPAISSDEAKEATAAPAAEAARAAERFATRGDRLLADAIQNPQGLEAPSANRLVLVTVPLVVGLLLAVGMWLILRSPYQAPSA
ncbi:hypothetical protein LOC68_16015 [Blastopirellula sp. JC732]|uniref:HEAT repeat domain-containing protein n=1 Tax=Blastopirellula sediminis TaxID=2894196 RepID=A0A9X1MP81_9BACT|nr:hypothetical protein [Blastopirellula sediminis]MCC9606806.1 hypothetical protein [Blastopirellula sediminis]MCC9629897.1 hypothetical protein [Blastopirellula sediminis]